MITDEKAAETLELEAARKEIEKLKGLLHDCESELLQYAHVANHDLQEPLRKIQIYATLLRDKAGSALDTSEIIEKIVRSSTRMRALITDISSYSKTLASGTMYRPVNLNDVAAGLADDFELAIAERKATLTIDALPVVNGVALQINQLFYNLLDNALKFSDPSRTPIIEVRCKKIDAKTVSAHGIEPLAGKVYYDITVCDNGIGFNARYAGEIIKVFARLHPKDVYPGSGIGLALCRRILANHGGALIIESNPGEGSAFHIIIPQ